MKSRISSNSSSKRLLSLKSNKVNSEKSNIKRAPSDLSVQDIQFPKVIENNEEVEEQTVLQVEIVNEELLRIRDKAQLGSKGTLLTYRWQAALTVGIVSFLLVAGISKLKIVFTLSSYSDKKLIHQNHVVFQVDSLIGRLFLKSLPNLIYSMVNLVIRIRVRVMRVECYGVQQVVACVLEILLGTQPVSIVVVALIKHGIMLNVKMMDTTVILVIGLVVDQR